MNCCELPITISALACCLAEDKSPEEITLLSSILMQLADTLATIAAQQAFCEARKDACETERKTCKRSF